MISVTNFACILAGKTLTNVRFFYYNKVRDSTVDGLKLFDQITLPDSLGRTFYAIPDGSFLLGPNGRETMHGEPHRIRDRRMAWACRENEALVLA